MLVCEILAAAAEDDKLLLRTASPTTDHTRAPLQADGYTDTTHPPAKTPPLRHPPLLPCRRPTHAHHRAHPRAPQHGPPPPARKTAHARHRPTRRTPLTTPHTREPAHTHQGEPNAARHARPAKWPAQAPAHTPGNPGPPPRPPNAANANCFPPHTPTHTTSRIAGPRPSQAKNAKTAAPRLRPPPLPTRSARQAARSRLVSPSYPP